MRRKALTAAAILLVLAFSLAWIVGCEKAGQETENDASEESATNGIDESDSTTQSISYTSEVSSGENSIPDVAGMTEIERRRFASNYLSFNVHILPYVGEEPTDPFELPGRVFNVQNLGDFDVAIVYSISYNLLDQEDPDFFNPDVQELKTEVVKIYTPAHSESIYLLNPGYMNRSGKVARPDGDAFLGIEFAGVYYTIEELYS